MGLRWRFNYLTRLGEISFYFSNSNMIIRKANKIDKDGIQVLMDELNLYRKKMFSSENKEFHERMNPYPPVEDADFDASFFFVAENDDKQIVGFIQGTIDQRTDHKLNKLGYIDELYVKDDFRGRGIAKNLFLELEKEFQKQECDHVTTNTDFENDLSQQFYSKAGMSKVTIELWKKL